MKALATDDLWNGGRLNDDKGLAHVSNKKLLHLHELLSSVQKEFGSRAKLIDAIAKQQQRDKDSDFRSGLEKKSTPAPAQIASAGKKRAKKNSA